MTDRITSLSQELLETTNLEEARRIARELQTAIRERVDHLHEQLRKIPKDEPDTGKKTISGGSKGFGHLAA